MDEQELKEIEARAEAAKEEVYALCLGRGRMGGKDFTMSIPPDKRRDSDFILLAPPRDDIPRLIEALRTERARATAQERVLNALRELYELEHNWRVIVETGTPHNFEPYTAIVRANGRVRDAYDALMALDAKEAQEEAGNAE